MCDFLQDLSTERFRFFFFTELPPSSRTYRKWRQSDIGRESSSSGTGSSSVNSDSEVAVRTSISATRKLGMPQDIEQRWREPLKVDVRSRSRERCYRNSSVRSQSYSGGKAEIRINATSPAVNSRERVFVFEKVDGKASWQCR